MCTQDRIIFSVLLVIAVLALLTFHITIFFVFIIALAVFLFRDHLGCLAKKVWSFIGDVFGDNDHHHH